MEFVTRAIRVLKLARKPTWEEIKATAKVTGLGIILIGLVGYMIRLVFALVRGLV